MLRLAVLFRSVVMWVMAVPLVAIPSPSAPLLPPGFRFLLLLPLSIQQHLSVPRSRVVLFYSPPVNTNNLFKH